jgi:DNA methylase
MLPAIAATAITSYTQSGDLIADPMCGIGTTLIEAIHLGRDAIGVEYEPRWARIAAANITHVRHGLRLSAVAGVRSGSAPARTVSGPGTWGPALYFRASGLTSMARIRLGPSSYALRIGAVSR